MTTVALAALMLTGCKKDFLDMAPDETNTIEDVFKNRVYTQKFLADIYSNLPLQLSMEDDNHYTGACDEMEIAWGGDFTHTMTDGGLNPTNAGRVNAWSSSYIAIRKCNIFLENIDHAKGSPDELRHWKGEAYFLRAFFHFIAFRAYGPVPILDRKLNPEDDIMSYVRRPADEVVKFICDDCDRAMEQLSDVNTVQSAEYSRPSRISCLALKSRALLYLASPLYNGNSLYAEMKDIKTGEPLINQTYDPTKWKKAADAALECIREAEDNGYALYNKYPEDPVKNYQMIFCDNWNCEVLYGKNYTNPGVIQHWLNCCDVTSFGAFSIYDPTQEMVDAYEMEDGSTPITGYTNNGMTPIINPKSGYDETTFATDEMEGRWYPGICNMYTHREPRFYASINFAGELWKTTKQSNWTEPHYNEFWFNGMDGKGHAGSDYCKTGYLMKKLHYPDYVHDTYIPKMTVTYFRLGEIYLNYAEALNEAEGPVSDVYKYVDAIRNRAALPGLEKGLSQDQMREKIRHERRIELAFETHRFFDTRRWLIGPETQGVPIHSMNIMEGNSLTDPAFYKRTFVENRVFVSPRNYLLPIEQSEIDKYEDHSLVQNLGWITE